MAFDRYDNRTRRNSRFGNREFRSPLSYGRNDGRGEYRDLDYDRNDRDFFERASDEIRSWFGDDRAERRRQMDERAGLSGRGYVNQSYSFEDNPQGYRRPYDERGYSRSFDRNDSYDYDRAYTQNRLDRGQTQAEFTNQSQGEFTNRGSFDDDYNNWRSQQIDQLDSDYAEWRSENARRFDDEFTNWRSERMTKREMMRTIPEHAEVIDCEGEHVGTIDYVKGDRMVLTKSDSEDGHHHSLTCRHLDTLDGDKVKLNVTAEQAKNEWRDEDRSRTFEQGSSEPRVFNRSFADTY